MLIVIRGLLSINIYNSNLDMNIRKLELGDFKKGYLELLGSLTEVGEGDYISRYKEFQILEPYIQIWVLEDIEMSKLLGTATLLIEPKIIHGCSKVGHIEDVVIHSDYQGKGLGKLLIEKLKEISLNEKCYKIILDCSEKKKVFYEKCGFENKNIQMCRYL